jgi:hypothetical protein
MGDSAVGVQLDGLPEYSFCTCPIPVGKELGIPQSVVSFGQRFVRLQRLGGRRLRLRQGLAGRRMGCCATGPAVAVSQTRVCQCIAGVYVDRVLEISEDPCLRGELVLSLHAL